MARRVASVWCLVMVLALFPGVSPARASGCYPPPCGSPEVTVAGPGTELDPTTLLSSSSEGDHRTAAPFAAAGLLMVTATLTTLCLRRRAAMAVPVRVGSPVPAGSPRWSLAHGEPEGSLR